MEAQESGKSRMLVTRNEVFCQTNCLLNCAATADRSFVMSSHSIPRRTLIQIEEELESEEEEVIKFACRDITSNTNVRELLSELNEESSHPVILELLYLLKRFDLIKKYCNMTKVEAERLLKRQSRVISDYRYIMIELNEQVEEHELDSIVFLLKNCLRNGGKLKNKTFLSLIAELEKNQLVTPNNFELLENMFQTIHRVDLKNRILKFRQKDNAVCVGGPYVNAHPASATFHRITSSTNPQLAASSKKDTTPVQETLIQIAGPEERYPVRKDHRGFCLIIDCVGNDAVSDSEEEDCVEVDGPRECAASRPQIDDQSKIPNEADIFWSHCRVNELELQRSSGSPSLYLRSLSDLLNEKKSRKDLLDIHTELNRIIYAKKPGYSLQLKHTLTKKLFL